MGRGEPKIRQSGQTGDLGDVRVNGSLATMRPARWYGSRGIVVFGIVRPCTHRLADGLKTEWMAHLCGLCLALRSDCGQFARVVTNYGGLIVSVLTGAQAERTPSSRRTAGPCPLRALRTAPVARGEGARLATAVSLVLASAKVRDHVVDRDGLLARRPVGNRAALPQCRRLWGRPQGCLRAHPPCAGRERRGRERGLGLGGEIAFELGGQEYTLQVAVEPRPPRASGTFCAADPSYRSRRTAQPRPAPSPRGRMRCLRGTAERHPCARS
jgi:hypothetical protein